MENTSSKSSKIEPRLLKGFRDYGLEEQASRQAMFAKIQSVFEQFGFLPLSTPVLEYLDILTGKIGEDEKLIYSFKDNGDRDVAMRYDLTIPLARYVAQNQGRLTFPFKRYCIAPVWRADNPQKGRLREFYQCDVDIVGTNSLIADTEVIACVCSALEAVGVKNYKVRLNDRATLKDFSIATIRAIDKLDKIGLEGIVEEMKRNNVSAEEIAKAKNLVADGAKLIPDSTKVIMKQLEEYGLSGKVEFDPTIARGLDYYTGTVFEIYLNDQPEFGSICSGGRYDNLVDTFSNQSLPAVGGSIGIDRLVDALSELGLTPKTTGIQVLILNLSADLQTNYIQLANGLRWAGINTEIYLEPAKLDKQFKYGERKNITWAVVMGEQEVASGMVKLKNFATREQTEVEIEGIAEQIKPLL